jgi:ABC-type molybdate transport system permease subunit
MPLRFNPKLVKAFLLCLIAGVIFSNLIIALFKFEVHYLDSIVVLVFILVPIVLGKYLFVIDERKVKDKNWTRK